MDVTPRYLADRSALARMHLDAVQDVLGPLLVNGEVATCALIELEIHFSARGSEEYEATAAVARRTIRASP